MSSLAIMISNLSPSAFLLFLLIPIYIFRKQVSKLQSFMLSYVIPITAHLKWVWSFLIHHSFFSHQIHDVGVGIGAGAEIGSESSVSQYKYKPGCHGEVVECAVCLSKIEEGEDAKELRCDHVFHRDCVDRWVGYRHRHATCPVCRDCIASQKPIVQYGMEVLVFEKFTYFSSRERETWWIR